VKSRAVLNQQHPPEPAKAWKTVYRQEDGVKAKKEYLILNPEENADNPTCLRLRKLSNLEFGSD